MILHLVCFTNKLTYDLAKFSPKAVWNVYFLCRFPPIVFVFTLVFCQIHLFTKVTSLWDSCQKGIPSFNFSDGINCFLFVCFLMCENKLIYMTYNLHWFEEIVFTTEILFHFALSRFSEYNRQEKIDTACTFHANMPNLTSLLHWLLNNWLTFGLIGNSAKVLEFSPRNLSLISKVTLSV